MSEDIILKHKNYTLKINSLGAELVSFSKMNEPNLLWEKTTIHWNRVAPLLFPIVGKLKENTYLFDDEEYSLSQHGFLRDQEFFIIEKNEDSISLGFTSNDETKKVYPFDFLFQITYLLDEKGLKIEAKIDNIGSSKMYYSYGGHPAFHLEDALENYSLRFPKAFIADRQLIEDGLYSGATEKMEISETLNLSDELFHSDAIVFKQPPFQEIELVHKTKGSILTMKSETWSAIGIWTKSGAPFLCLEPWWGWADSKNSTGDLIEKEGIRTLESGAMESLVYRIEPA